MFVKVAADGSVSLEDRDNFRAFKLVVEGGPARLDAGAPRAAGTAELPDQATAWIYEKALRERAEVANDAAWQGRSRHDDREGQAARLDRRAEEGDQGPHRVDGED